MNKFVARRDEKMERAVDKDAYLETATVLLQVTSCNGTYYPGMTGEWVAFEVCDVMEEMYKFDQF